MKTLSKLVALASVLLALGAAQVQAQSTVYSNFGTDLSANFNPGTAEVGNTIYLAGTDRTITDFQFQYWGANLPTDANVTLRFYADDGPGGTPGTLLYQADPFTITSTNRGAIDYNINYGDLKGTGVTVGNDFTWTVTFTNLGTGTAGLTLYSPPTVGNVNADYYSRPDQSSSFGTPLTGNPSPTFGASAIATVPEPTTMTLLGLGGLAGFVWKRRKAVK